MLQHGLSYATSSLSALVSHGALSNNSSSSSSSSSRSDTLPDVRDLSGPESDSGDTLFSTSPGSPSPPTSVSTGRSRGTGVYGQRVDGTKASHSRSHPVAAAATSPSQGRISRAAFNSPFISSVREDPEEEGEDPTHTSTYLHHRRFISSPERSRGLNKPVGELTPRSRKAATVRAYMPPYSPAPFVHKKAPPLTSRANSRLPGLGPAVFLE